MKNSDFAAVRHHLERAYKHLHGHDETSVKIREALDLLIEAAAVAEHNRSSRQANILKFPGTAKRSRSETVS